MLGFKRRKKKAPTSPPKEEKGVGEMGLVGGELHVNPPANISLKRMEARLVRINKMLEGKLTEERRVFFEHRKRLIEAKIQIEKGEI